MSVSVLIPWRSTDCPHRTRALAWVLAKLAQHPWPVVIGQCDEGPWVKATAVADALSQTDAEVLIVADADCWSDGLAAAVEAVQDGRAAWAIPHRGVLRLTEDSTRRYLAGEPLDGLPLSERAYLGVECGGIFVVRRDVYEATGFDPRFLGWSGEDEALSHALRALYGPPWRGKARLFHLWHPPQERASRARGSEANHELRKRYVRAHIRNNQAAMAALIEEGRQCLSPRS